MKSKKINLLIIYLFLIFSFIKSKELLEEWENNTQNKIESSIQNTKPFNSYAINNITDTKIYLNDEYLYIINQDKLNKTIPNSEKINSIDSPLIQYNQDYYFCSGINLYKIGDESLKLEKIAINPQEYTGSINSLKCSSLISYDSFFVGLIGSNYLLTYKMSKTEDNIKYKQLLGNLKAITTYNIDTKISFISTLYQNNIDKKYILKIFKFENNDFNEVHEICLSDYSNFEFADNSNIKISFLTDKIILIISYIKNKELHFYHFDFGSNILELVGGNNILRSFNQYSVITADFLENTPYIYYIITRDERYYLGVADLKYYIIVYNIEIEKTLNIIYDEGYYYQSKLFLNYFENNNHKIICPFVLNSTLCQHELEDKYFVISNEYSSNGLNQNYFSDLCSGKVIGNYCLQKCPVGSSDSGKGTCFQCTYNVYFNYGDKKCSEVCDYISENKICYDCERNNQIYYNYDCVNSCKDVYKIYDEKGHGCKDCEDGKYFDTKNNECIDKTKCPEDSEIDDINKACINCEQLNMYSLTISGKTRCYKKCPQLYYAKNNKCISCESEEYYQDGECVKKCGTGYITIPENKFCQSCKELGKIQCNNECIENCDNCKNNQIEENGACVSKCSDGYILNENKCESCLEKGLYYYNGQCKEKCFDFDQYLAWNDTDHICKDCSEVGENFFFEDNKCVKQCKEAARQIDSICFTCHYPEIYYFYGACNKECPENTVPNKIQESCSYCPDDTYFLNKKCLKECKEPYISVTKDNHKVCDICPEGYWYTLKRCKPQCDDNCYSLDEERTCHLCYCHDQGDCLNNHTSECRCNDQYFGRNCEFYRKNTEKRLIIPLYNRALRTNVSFYGFDKTKVKFNNFKIKWEFLFDKKEITSNPEYKTYFVTGVNEEIFGINPGLFADDKKNWLHLTITSENNEKLEDEIRIHAQNLNNDLISSHKSNFLDPKLQDTGLLYKPMNTKIEIEQIEYNNMNQFKYYYQFSILDGNDEEFPLTNFNNPKELETYYIPFAKQYKVNIKNDIGELIQYKILRDDSDIYKNFNNDEFNSKSIKDIIDDSNYNDIEKLFIFIIIFNSKEKVLRDDNNIEILFNFIKDNFKNFLNANGYYNINTSENAKIINYAEPRLLFALINSIIINQRKKLNFYTIQLILDYLKECVDLLDENIKLSSKDVISLLRTVEQLHDVYNEYNFNDIDLSEFYYLFEKINNYLTSRLYPGEGIKIIGSRTILFSYNLGYYQELLAISSNNLTTPSNISNISSYSYEDYGLNEESCGKNGETFLCFNRNIYKNIKEKLQQNGYEDIKNISLNIYIVNNIKNAEHNILKENILKEEGNNNNTEEIDNYLVHFKFYDSNQNIGIDNLITDENLFYSLEFSYKNEKRKTSSFNKNNDNDDIFYMPYNYSNVFCYPQNYAKNKTYYCFTYFDYSINIIQCKCNIIDEIAIIENEELANFYKNLQFDTSKYTYTNKVMKYFVSIFVFLLLVPGLLFLMFDLYKINKRINANGLNYKEKRREYYHQVRSYTNSTLSFPIYSTFNVFPFFAAFNASHYTSPKFIKHLIVITAILLGFNLNLIPFYFTLPFEERQILIDKRDINVDEDEIHSIRIINKYLVRGFIYAIISLLIVHLFIWLFNKILKIDEKNKKYWRNIKEIFKDFVYLEIKKSRYLGKNFARIKNRMKAFYALCGKYLLNKNIVNNPERNKKLENYLKYSGKISINKNIKIKDDSEMNNNKIGTKRESLINGLNENNSAINDDGNDQDDENRIIKTEYKPPKINININTSVNKDLNISSSFGNNKKKKLGDILNHLNPTRTDAFQYSKMNGINYGISNDTICRFEKIKNKYINSNRVIGKNSSKRKINYNKASNLIICYEKNISIFMNNDYSVILKNDVDFENQKEYRLLVLMSCVLGFIFLLLIFLSILFIKKLMNEYEYFMVKIWLLCTILILFVAYFLIYFIKVVIASILLFNCYHSRNKGCFIKNMFKIFVDKNLIYMYKIRNYITKYKREFINI